jgi:hypothetical protein
LGQIQGSLNVDVPGKKKQKLNLKGILARPELMADEG